MADEIQFWDNLMVTFPNITLKEAEEEYRKISSVPFQFITASNLFPIVNVATSTGRYDFVVWYKKKPVKK